jgi:hypothetical protein
MASPWSKRRAVSDFYSPDEIKRVYYPEVERLLRDNLGASRVFVFGNNVRNATREGLVVPSLICTTTTVRIGEVG